MFGDAKRDKRIIARTGTGEPYLVYSRHREACEYRICAGLGERPPQWESEALR